jgi:hypothetical protein
VEYISHRINRVCDLEHLAHEIGVEIDLRDDLEGNIYLEHEPFKKGEKFIEYLKSFHHNTMILNIKSERIELGVLGLLKRYNIKKYFFLDSSFPMIKFLSDRGEKNIALRFSEFEGIDTLKNMSGRVNWVWVDCFTMLPINHLNYRLIKDMGYKLCLVSPELQGQSEKIKVYCNQIIKEGIIFDAICTKQHNIAKWQKYFSQSI